MSPSSLGTILIACSTFVLGAIFATLYYIHRFIDRAYRAVLAVLPESISIVAASPSDFPTLDLSTLDTYTRDLQWIGFEPLLDHTVVQKGGKSIAKVFGRLFVHRSRNTYATVGQVFAPNRSLPVFCTILTHFTDDWSVAIGNNQPQSGSVFIRNPRAVGQSMPGSHPRELLETHDRWRDEMMSDLGIKPLEVSVEAYEAFEARRAKQRRDQLLRSNFSAKLAAYYNRKATPVFANKGDWPKEAAKRKGRL